MYKYLLRLTCLFILSFYSSLANAQYTGQEIAQDSYCYLGNYFNSCADINSSLFITGGTGNSAFFGTLPNLNLLTPPTGSGIVSYGITALDDSNNFAGFMELAPNNASAYYFNASTSLISPINKIPGCNSNQIPMSIIPGTPEPIVVGTCALRGFVSVGNISLALDSLISFPNRVVVSANAINSSYQNVGVTANIGGFTLINFRGYFFDPITNQSNLLEIAPLPAGSTAYETYANDIDDQGHIVGFAIISPFSIQHPILWTQVAGTWQSTFLPVPPGAIGARATTINEYGKVGGVVFESQKSTAIIWDLNLMTYQLLDQNTVSGLTAVPAAFGSGFCLPSVVTSIANTSQLEALAISYASSVPSSGANFYCNKRLYKIN